MTQLEEIYHYLYQFAPRMGHRPEGGGEREVEMEAGEEGRQ